MVFPIFTMTSNWTKCKNKLQNLSYKGNLYSLQLSIKCFNFAVKHKSNKPFFLLLTLFFLIFRDSVGVVLRCVDEMRWYVLESVTILVEISLYFHRGSQIQPPYLKTHTLVGILFLRWIYTYEILKKIKSSPFYKPTL